MSRDRSLGTFQAGLSEDEVLSLVDSGLIQMSVSDEDHRNSETLFASNATFASEIHVDAINRFDASTGGLYIGAGALNVRIGLEGEPKGSGSEATLSVISYHSFTRMGCAFLRLVDAAPEPDVVGWIKGCPLNQVATLSLGGSRRVKRRAG